MRNQTGVSKDAKNKREGFSLIELLVSVSIITILMAMVFQFLSTNQRRYRSQQLFAEVNQGGRSAFEVITQELNQAGYNPPFQVSKTLGAAYTANGTIQALTLSGGSPAVKRVFYGTRLIVGNSCTATPPIQCNQEEVVVNQDRNLSATAMTTTAVPVLLATSHANSEPVFSRNYPFPNGIIYENIPALGSYSNPFAIADNKLLFFGDVMNSGDLYYGEYRLRCAGATAGTYIDACTTGCMGGLGVGDPRFILTRFMTRLANADGVFKIPPSKADAYDGATESPLADNILGTCPDPAGFTAPANWNVATVPDETASGGTTTVRAAIDYSSGTAAYVRPVLNPDGTNTPLIWFKLNTYGAWDTAPIPAKPFFQSYVLDVRFTLTAEERQKDPETNTYRRQRLQTHIVPRNINNALAIASNGGSLYLPLIPRDPAPTSAGDCTGTSPNIKCPSLPLGVKR